jgi:hypothetical protein
VLEEAVAQAQPEHQLTILLVKLQEVWVNHIVLQTAQQEFIMQAVVQEFLVIRQHQLQQAAKVAVVVTQDTMQLHNQVLLIEAVAVQAEVSQEVLVTTQLVPVVKVWLL